MCCCWLCACCGRTDYIWSGIRLGLRHRECHTNTNPVKFAEYNCISSPGLQGITILHHLAAGSLIQYSEPYVKSQPVRLRGTTSTAPTLLRVDPEPFQVPIRINTFLEYSWEIGLSQVLCLCRKQGQLSWKEEGLHHSFACNNSRKLTIYLCTISHDEPISHLLPRQTCFHMPFLPAFIYAALVESFCKRLVHPRARRLYQQAHLLSRVPSVSQFSQREEFSLPLLLHFTFATGFCLFVCLIPHHSPVSFSCGSRPTWCQERAGSRSEAQELQL